MEDEAPTSRRIWFAALIPLVLILIGTAGYVLIEHWGWFDALYMTVLTLTTIGFLEVHELSQAGRAFTIGLALGGAFSVATAAAVVLRAIVSGEFLRRFGKQRMETTLASISDHVIVCGYGRVGRLVAEDLGAAGVRSVIIDNARDRLHGMSTPHIVGDVTTDDVLARAGIVRARALVTVLPSDADNLYVTMSSRLLNEKLFIVARAEGEGAEDKLRRAGANRVISPTSIGGQRMAQAILRPAVLDFLDLATRTRHLELQVEEVLVPRASKLHGTMVKDARLPERADVLLVAIQRGEGRMIFNPPQETLFEEGDRLVVLGSRPALDKLEAIVRE